MSSWDVIVSIILNEILSTWPWVRETRWAKSYHFRLNLSRWSIYQSLLGWIHSSFIWTILKPPKWGSKYIASEPSIVIFIELGKALQYGCPLLLTKLVHYAIQVNKNYKIRFFTYFLKDKHILPLLSLHMLFKMIPCLKLNFAILS